MDYFHIAATCSMIGYLCLLTIVAVTSAEDDSVFPAREFRGVWIATVSNIDWPSSSHLSSEQQKDELLVFLDKLQQLNFNAVVFQIRPAGDALYNSTYEPWSAYLTGQQGARPTLTMTLSSSPSKKRTNATLNYTRGSTLTERDPEAVVRPGSRLITWPIAFRDGVHIDDYFYPYPVSGETFPDSDTYRAYTDGGGTLPLGDWRRHNVDTLIQRLANGIRNVKSYVKFGISPFGIWKPGHPSGIVGLNSYTELYGDSRKWFQEGWADYLAPQLYWKIDPPSQSYTALLDWWADQNNQRHHLYAGNYVGRVQLQNWPLWEIENQIAESRKRRDRCSLGNIQFSAKYIRDGTRGIDGLFGKVYSHRRLCHKCLGLIPPRQWRPLKFDTPMGISRGHRTLPGR
ncbi:hypothetical protein ScPMuIL_016199 [Solemya velum]